MPHPSLDIIVPEVPAFIPSWAAALIFVTAALIGVVLLANFWNSPTISKADIPMTILGFLLILGAVAFSITSLVTNSLNTKHWYNEVAEITNSQYTSEELTTAGLLFAVQADNVTTLQAETGSHGLTNIHVDGRAITFIPATTPTNADLMNSLQTLCNTKPGPTTPQEKQICTAYANTPK